MANASSPGGGGFDYVRPSTDPPPNPKEGEEWWQTDNNDALAYSEALDDWVDLRISDHTQLSNVSAGQHFSPGDGLTFSSGTLALLLSGYLTIDTNGKLALASGSIGQDRLAFDTATQAELDAFSPPITEKFGTQTFAGNDGESISYSKHGGLRQTNGHIELMPASDRLTWTGDSNTKSRYQDFGVVFEPKRDCRAVEVGLDNDVGNPNALYLYESNADNQLDKISNPSGGNTYTMTANMQAGKEYDVFPYNGGNDFTQMDNNNTSPPVSGNHIDLVDGIEGRLSDYTYNRNGDLWNISSLKPVTLTNDATATVRWTNQPENVYDWDSVAFQVVEDGETVTVDIQEYDGSWSTIQSNVNRGDEITASPSNPIRFKINLSRSSSSNNPRIESLHHQYQV